MDHHAGEWRGDPSGETPYDKPQSSSTPGAIDFQQSETGHLWWNRWLLFKPIGKQRNSCFAQCRRGG